MDAKERLVKRFTNEVQTKRLADVKFFVRRGRVSVETICEELNCFEDVIAAGDSVAVTNIDISFPKTKYNLAFE